MNKSLRNLSLVAVVAMLFGAMTTSPALGEEWSMGKSWNKLWNPDTKEKKKVYQTPTRVVALWSPAMYSAPGKPATRGFGGRIYFYNNKDEPIPIEGQQVVYGFNDTIARTDASKADRKFVFTTEQLSNHFSPGELGASYSIWIPWDAVGGPQLEVSLLPIFTTAKGQLVMGEQSKNLLPGSTTQATVMQQQRTQVQPIIIDHRVAPASHTSPVDFGQQAQQAVAEPGYYTHIQTAPPQENIRATSIQLTRSLAERLIQERTINPAASPIPNSNVAPAGYQQPATTYPIPAGTMSPNVTQFQPGQQPQVQSFTSNMPTAYPQQQAPYQQQPPPGFTVPQAGSRSWGPTLPRNSATANAKLGNLPAGAPPQGQSPARFAPQSPLVPMTTSPPPASYQQPTQPGLGAQGYLPPPQPQSGLYPAAQAGWNNASVGGR